MSSYNIELQDERSSYFHVDLAALRQQALRSITRSSKKVSSKSRHKEDHHDNQIEADFGINELLVDASSKKQIGSKQQQLGLPHLSDTSAAALKELHNEPKLEFEHGEQRNRRTTEKESENNHSISRSVSTYSSSSRSHSYSSNGSNSPSGSVTSGSSYTPTHSSASSKSNYSTHADMIKSDTREKYLPHSEPLKKSSTRERKLGDPFPSSPHHTQSDRSSFTKNGSGGGRTSRDIGDHQYEEQPSRLLGRRRDPLREPLRSNDERRREPLRLQPNDERSRETLRLQSNDERGREPLRVNDERRESRLRLQPNDERRREPLRLQSNGERRRGEPSRLHPNDGRSRETLRLQSNDERGREPLRVQPNDERRRESRLRLQPNDERRREPLRLQPNDGRRRKPVRLQSSEERRREARSREEPLRLQPRDERRREPLGLQSNNDRRRETVRLRSSEDRRRETVRLQPREERRRDARSREEPSRLQSDGMPQYSGVRRIRRSPFRAGGGAGYSWRVDSSREENSDSKRNDSRQSLGQSRSNRSPMHLASTGRHVGTLDSQAHNNPEIEQNTHKKPVLSSPQRASYQKQGEREIAPCELQNRKRRASPDAQPIDFAQKRVHVDERRENVYSSKESKERKRGSSSDDGRRHHHTTKTTVHDDVTNISEQEPPKLNHRKESQDHEREYSEPVKSERELWSEPASDHPVTERADLLGLSDTQVKDVEEELDYDENMDDIDVHVYRPEDLDVEEKDNEEKNIDQSISSVPEPPAVSVLPDEPETLGEVLIRSPIRVSPERKRFKAKDSERLPVKERLYLSKSAIQRKKEERLVHYHEDPKPQLRPSLASRLGPAPRRRGSKHKESSGKESAAATVDEYRKKKQEVDMRQEDIERARRIAKSLNEHDTKPATRAHATEDKNTQPQEKEKSLDEVIDKIKEKNKSIVRRKKEIEMDVEQYGQ